MDAGGAEKIESEYGLGKETVPFGKRKVGINGAEDRDEVIFKGANRTFGSIGAMLFGWDALKVDIVFEECVL